MGQLRITFTPNLTPADMSAARALSEIWRRRTSRVCGSSAASRGWGERSLPTSEPTASSVSMVPVQRCNRFDRHPGDRKDFWKVPMSCPHCWGISSSLSTSCFVGSELKILKFSASLCWALLYVLPLTLWPSWLRSGPKPTQSLNKKFLLATEML